MATPDEWVDDNPSNGTWWDTAKNVGQTVDDTVRAAANAITFGGADRYAGAMEGLASGKGYSAGVDEQVKLSDEARKRSPYASVIGDVGGSVALPGFGAARLAARLGGGAVARARGYGATGAATGAAQGAGNVYSEKPSDYLTGAAYGAMVGGPLGAIGGAAFGRGPAQSSARTPTTADLEHATDIAYDTFRALPARYTPASFAAAGQDANVALRTAGHFDAPTTHGGSPVPFRAVDQMQAPPTAVSPVTGDRRLFISPADIDTVRKGTTGERIAGLDPWQQSGAGIVRRGIDDFVTNPPPGAVVPGTEAAARQAGGIYDTARQMHAGSMRTGALDEMIRNAERTSGATHSGLNLRNELQKTIRTGLKEKKGDSSFSKAGYSPAEIAEFNRFSRGQGNVSRTMGYVDKYLGGGGGLGALIAGGIGGKALSGEDDGTGIAKGLGVSALGLGLRTIGNRRAAADINRVRDLIAQRNPLYQARAANAPMVPGPGSPRAAKAMRDALALQVIQQTQPRRLDIDTSDWE